MTTSNSLKKVMHAFWAPSHTRAREDCHGR